MKQIKNFPYPYIQYGSANSTDIDVAIIIPQNYMKITQEDRKNHIKKLMLDFDLNWNAIFICVEDGVVVDTIFTKSWIDSINNAIYYTYSNHVQFYPNPITRLIKRNKTLAIYKAVRTVLSQVTRTNYKSRVKPVMKGFHDFNLKLDVLKNINFKLINSFNQRNTNDVDCWKSIAFYVIQNMALLNDVHIHTKDDAIVYDQRLSKFINRDEITVEDKIMLNTVITEWLNMLSKYKFITTRYRLKCWEFNECSVDMKNEKY